MFVRVGHSVSACLARSAFCTASSTNGNSLDRLMDEKHLRRYASMIACARAPNFVDLFQVCKLWPGPLRAGGSNGSGIKAKEALARAASGAMLGVIAFYQTAIGPLMGKNCRFVPSCSDYFKEAIETLGPTKGAILIAWRLMRCNPAGGSGYDPVTWPPVGFRAGS
jgi:uncharacterized protein